jgi:hypothetical protein
MRAFLLSATLCSSPVWSQQQTAPAQAKPDELAALQQGKLKSAVAARHGILYDTGFDLHSKRQFCSRYVREVVEEAADVQLGQVENFATLLKNNPQADQAFWRTWYLGNIPWQRETVTPASLLQDAKLHAVFDGRVARE